MLSVLRLKLVICILETTSKTKLKKTPRGSTCEGQANGGMQYIMVERFSGGGNIVKAKLTMLNFFLIWLNQLVLEVRLEEKDEHVSTLERFSGGGNIVDLIFNRHLSDISLSLLSKLRSLLYIGGAHICDNSLILSLSKDASFITACHNSTDT